MSFASKRKCDLLLDSSDFCRDALNFDYAFIKRKYNPTFGEKTLKKAIRTLKSKAAQVQDQDWKVPVESSTFKPSIEKSKVIPRPNSKWKKFIAISDLHGNHSDYETVRKVLSFADQWNPHYRLGLGDFWDFGPLRDGATLEERSHSMQPDWDAGVEFLNNYFVSSSVNMAVLGNHDFRPFKWRNKSSAVEREFAFNVTQRMETLFDSLSICWKEYHKRSILKLGKLTAVHGFSSGVNAAKSHCQWYGDGDGSVVLFGHTHRISSYTDSSMNVSQSYNIGCLCSLDLGYNDLQPGTLAQKNGFVYGAINDDSGDVHIWQAQSSGDVWLLPSDLVEV